MGPGSSFVGALKETGFRHRVSQAGVAVFPSIVRAARALGLLVDWQHARRDLMMP